MTWYLDVNGEYNYSAGLRPMLLGHYYHIITLAYFFQAFIFLQSDYKESQDFTIYSLVIIDSELLELSFLSIEDLLAA